MSVLHNFTKMSPAGAELFPQDVRT